MLFGLRVARVHKAVVVSLVVVGLFPLPAVAAGPGTGAASTETVGPGIEVTRVAVSSATGAGDVAASSSTFVAVPEGATIAMATWAGESTAGIAITSWRGSSSEGGVFGALNPEDGPDPDEPGSGNRWSTAPIWLADGVEQVEVVHQHGDTEDVRVDFLTIDDGVTPSDAPPAVGGAEATRPPIRPREDWRAPGWVYGNEDCEDGPLSSGFVNRATVHHTVTQNDYPPAAADDLILGIFYSHTQVNGWCDIGYNFIVDRYGTVWEGRTDSIELPIRAAHTFGLNRGSVGIAMLGTHHPGQTIPAASVPGGTPALIAAVISWKFEPYGIDPLGTVRVRAGSTDLFQEGEWATVPAIHGHRDVGATSCPGNIGYATLPSIRAAVEVDLTGPRDVFLRNVNADGPADVSFEFGVGDQELLVGDWNGDGSETFGVRVGKFFHLWNTDRRGEPDLIVKYGLETDEPVVGDWDGDGTDTVGVRRGNLLLLRNLNEPGPAQLEFAFGKRGDELLVGDWDGDGTESVGTRRGNLIFLTNGFRSGPADVSYGFGRASDIVLIGDWDGDGTDTVGTRRGNVMYFGNRTISGPADVVFGFGVAGDNLLIGDWDGDGVATPGVIRPLPEPAA